MRAKNTPFSDSYDRGRLAKKYDQSAPWGAGFVIQPSDYVRTAADTEAAKRGRARRAAELKCEERARLKELQDVWD